MPRECVFTVSSLTTSLAAIARLDRPADQQREHLALPLGQAQVGAGPELAAVQPGGGQRHPAGQRRVDEHLAVADPAQVVDQLAARGSA